MTQCARDGWKRAVLASVVTAISLLFAAFPGQSTSRGHNQFCDAKRVRNYAGPHRNWERYRPVPRAGQVWRGSQVLHVRHDGPRPGGVLQTDYESMGNRILTGRGWLGYRLESQASTRESDLGLKVVLAGFSLNGKGEVTSKLGQVWKQIGLRVGSVSRALNLRIPDRVSFYRFDLSVEQIRGSKVRRFSEFIRVMEPFADARLNPSGRSFEPGDMAFGRIENLGTTLVGFRRAYSVEYFNGIEWQRVGPRRTVWRGPLIDSYLYAGEAGGCMSFRIPGNALTGRYRLAKHVRVRAETNGWREQVVYGEFDVRHKWD
jgi:hypothetical protein